jgi:hypothetical protein
MFLAVVIAAIWITYWPSLEHVPRADQWAYLIDTRECNTFGELWTASYSYNRVRSVGPGDTDLFRPVLFTLLCVEKYLFGNNFEASQALGLGLHCAVVLLFFALLRRIERVSFTQTIGAAPPVGPAMPIWLRLMPHALTVFFALNFASMELVVWAHLHGYLLFLVFVLAALLLLMTYVYRPDLAPRRRDTTLVSCWALALLAAFTYELGQLCAVVIGLVILAVDWRRRGKALSLALACCFVAILPLYNAINRWDMTLHAGRFPEEDLQQQMVQKALSLDTVEHAARFLTFTVVQPFFPSVTGWWYQGERIHIQEPVFGWIKYVQPNGKLVLSYGIAFLFFGFCIAGLRRFRRGEGRALWPVFAVAAGLFVFYAGITVLGRMNMRPSHFVLCSNSYYTYIALLFFLIAAFTLWQPVAAARTRLANGCRLALCVGLVFLGCYSAGRIHHAAERLRGYYSFFRDKIRQLDEFVATHRDETGFRLAFDMRPDAPFPETHSIPFTEILYTRWIDNHQPTYVVAFPDGELSITSAADYRRQHPDRRQLFPDLVRVGSDYNIHFWEGKYYGSLHWDDVFRPDLKAHAYVIVGDSVKEVLDLVPVRYEEFMEDLRTGWCIPPRMGTKVIDEDYCGFELVEAGAYFYATPAAEGPFRVDRFNGRRFSTVFVADDLWTLQRYVDEHVLTTVSRSQAPLGNDSSGSSASPRAEEKRSFWTTRSQAELGNESRVSATRADRE